MILASWNVNGIRACEKKGFSQWVNENNFDIIALQETKANEEQLDDTLKNIKGYESYFFSADKKGYSGVALYIKETIDAEVIKGIEIAKFDTEGRTIAVKWDKNILINGYYPNGQRDHNRVPYKLEYSETILKIASDYRKQGLNVILCGDFNTAHTELDLANPKTNKKTTGFLPHEREYIDKLNENNFIDIFREYNPDENGHYTWWTYRGNCRERNIGWRIDYFFVDQKFKKKIKSAKIHPETLGSDHCPISISF